MRSLFVWTLFVLLTGCITEQKCNERFPPQVVNTVTTWESYSCDSFPVYVDALTLSFDTSGVIPDNINFHHTHQKGNLTQTLSIHNGKIIQTCHEDSLRTMAHYWKKMYFQKETVKEIKKVTEFKEHWYDPPCRWIAGFVLTAITIYLIYVIIRFVMQFI